MMNKRRASLLLDLWAKLHLKWGYGVGILWWEWNVAHQGGTWAQNDWRNLDSSSDSLIAQVSVSDPMVKADLSLETKLSK